MDRDPDTIGEHRIVPTEAPRIDLPRPAAGLAIAQTTTATRARTNKRTMGLEPTTPGLGSQCSTN